MGIRFNDEALVMTQMEISLNDVSKLNQILGVYFPSSIFVERLLLDVFQKSLQILTYLLSL